MEKNIRVAPDVESQAALRRGIAAEQSQQHRVQRWHQEWQRNRSRTRLTDRSIASDKWEEVPYRRRKRVSKPPHSQMLTLEKRYHVLRAESQLSEGESSGEVYYYTPDTLHSQGKSISRDNEESSRTRHQGARRVENSRRQMVSERATRRPN